MKHVSNLLLTLFTVFFCIGCATFHSSVNEQPTKPDDFRIEYAWREGSLPPPYHYEYTVILKPLGQSEIVFIPDYPSADVPTWVENFNVTEQDLNALYHVMVKNGLFTQKRQKMDSAPIGGSNQTLIVTAQGKRITVEDYLISEQQASAQTMYSAVHALIPKEIWERLQARRSKYIQEHTRK